MRKIRTSVSIDRVVLEEAKLVAEAEGRTLSNYFTRALETVNKAKLVEYNINNAANQPPEKETPKYRPRLLRPKTPGGAENWT